jgi:septal ring factor EnvC (AmiA/AmiB activator)
MDQLGNQAETRAALEALPGPLPRPPKPGEAPSPIDTIAWSRDAPPYRLPVDGKIVTGLGELSDAGVRSRGLTLATASAAQVIAPAAGRIVFARRFRDYGTVIIIDHGGGWTSLIAHLGEATVAVGARVAQGAPIGRAKTIEEPRVTIELRRKDRAIDMTRLLG